MRTMLRRMLEQVGVESKEMENGLELLTALEDEDCDVDFAVIDIDMPILNGTETLRAIRSSPKYRDMPVVCVSSAADQDVVKEMIGIGLSDYLLKPIRPEVAIPRLRNILRTANRWRKRTAATSINELLLVDHDPNFLAFAKPILAANYGVIQATSGVKAVSLYQQRSPTPNVVLVGEGLPLLSEIQLVETLRRTANQLEAQPPEVYLLSFSEHVDPEKARHFHGVISKTFVPDQFSAAFRRVVLKSMSPLEQLTSLLNGDLQPELLSATQQAIGVLVGQDVFRLPPEEVAALQLPIRAAIAITEPASGAAIEVTILSSETSVIGMATRMLGKETSLADGAGEILGELANVLAGRLRASLLHREIDLKMGLPECATDPTPQHPSDWTRPNGYRCAGGEQFMVGFRVVQGTADANYVKPSAAPALEESAVTAAGSLDDVLF